VRYCSALSPDGTTLSVAVGDDVASVSFYDAERALALCMSSCPRLGAISLLSELEPSLLRAIWELLPAPPLHECTHVSERTAMPSSALGGGHEIMDQQGRHEQQQQQQQQEEQQQQPNPHPSRPTTGSRLQGVRSISCCPVTGQVFTLGGRESDPSVVCGSHFEVPEGGLEVNDAM
jgi:hypothetical protein